MPKWKRKSPQPDPPPTGVLDWTDRKHWGRVALPCRYQCGGPMTQLRDSSRKPAHKICAEAAFQRQAAEAAESYENERRLA